MPSVTLRTASTRKENPKPSGAMPCQIAARGKAKADPGTCHAHLSLIGVASRALIFD